MTKKPEIIVFAGPNGSGKSTIFELTSLTCPYINADEIKKSSLCTDLEAAQLAENIREALLEVNEEFAFETVLSTRRNLDLLNRAKQKGYFIRCIYVLTNHSSINVARVAARKASGGHGVPENKIRSRYVKALQLLPELISVCDICHIYDNSKEPFRIFKKRKEATFFWENTYWKKEDIERLTGRSL